MSGKVKKVEILKKMKLKIRLEYSDKTTFFGLKLFLKRPLETFLWTLRTCSRYLKGAINLELYAGKRIRTQGYVFMKIFAKTCWGRVRKQPFFPNSNLRDESHDVFFQYPSTL